MPRDRNEAGGPTGSHAARSQALWTGLKSTLARKRQTITNLAEDIVILSQFAFGREYIRRPTL